MARTSTSASATVKARIPAASARSKLATGEQIWTVPGPNPRLCAGQPRCSSSQGGAVTLIPGAVIAGSHDGGLRAYSTADGTVLWQFDTNKEFTTVNGVKATGASIDGSPLIVCRRHDLRELRLRRHRSAAGKCLPGVWPGLSGSPDALLPRHGDADSSFRVNQVICVLRGVGDRKLHTFDFAVEGVALRTVIRGDRRTGVLADIAAVVG